MITTTLGERLLIWRTRNKITQKNAADFYNVGVDMYRAWEQDVRIQDQPQLAARQQLQAYEKLFLRRVRAKMSQEQLAKKMGVTRQWVIRMETGRGPIRQLENYWNNHGTQN